MKENVFSYLSRKAFYFCYTSSTVTMFGYIVHEIFAGCMPA